MRWHSMRFSTRTHLLAVLHQMLLPSQCAKLCGPGLADAPAPAVARHIQRLKRALQAVEAGPGGWLPPQLQLPRRLVCTPTRWMFYVGRTARASTSTCLLAAGAMSMATCMPLLLSSLCSKSCPAQAKHHRNPCKCDKTKVSRRAGSRGELA